MVIIDMPGMNPKTLLKQQKSTIESFHDDVNHILKFLIDD